MRVFRQFLELIRFSHTVFALPFALLAAVLAWRDVGAVRALDVVGIVLCMVFARSAAMAFNRLADADVDAKNPRTAKRHIPAGLLSPTSVGLFTAACVGGFIASTFLFSNPWPAILSVPVMAFLLLYSYAKRVTVWCHYWLALALALSPVAAWIAITGRVDLTPVLLGASVFFWVGGFDIIYACQDVDFDRDNRLKSIPARWGIATALRLACVSHLIVVGCLIGLWWEAQLGVVFLTGTLCVGGLLIYEHRLVRPNDLTRVNVAFFQVNAIISLGLLVVGLADVWMS